MAKRSRAPETLGDPVGCDVFDVSPAELFEWIDGSKDPLNVAALTKSSGVGSDGPMRSMSPGAMHTADGSTSSQQLAFIAGFLADEASAEEAESQQANEETLDSLASCLPKQYQLATSQEDKEIHAALLRQVRVLGQTVATSWVRSRKAGEPLLRLHIVFRDRYTRLPMTHIRLVPAA